MTSDVNKQTAKEADVGVLTFDSDTMVGQIWEMKRLQSLHKWPMAKPSAREMAEAGFYRPNPETCPGAVKCFSCFIELDGWEPADDPWEEHKKRSSALDTPCEFVKIGKKESEHTVKDNLDILKSVMLRTAKVKCERNLRAALYLHKKKKASLRQDLKNLGMS